jgi:hypothetical protein
VDSAGLLPDGRSHAREDFRVLYVGGMGRSGTTMIERLLNEIPGFWSVGEITHLWQRCLLEGEACGCGVPFRSCEFWSAVGDEAFGGWSRVSAHEVLGLVSSVDRLRHVPKLLRGEPAPAVAARLRRYAELYDALYAAVSKLTGSQIIVDASKKASLAACLRHLYHRDRLSFVHVLRDPRAVAYAWTKRAVRPMATEASSEPEMARYSPARSAVHWNLENAVLVTLARSVPTMRVRYEDFVHEPAESLARLTAFAGHSGPQPAGLAEGVRLSQLHAISGNPAWTGSKRVVIAEDDRWRSALRTRDRMLVTALTAPTRGRFGY